MSDSAEDIARDVAAVGRIQAVPTLLRVLCDTTGMGFAAVARVTDGTWTACAVQDDIQFGLKPGGQLDVHTTLCKEVRAARTPVVIDQASVDPVYCNHHTPRHYSIESYVSVPIMLGDGAYFGNLCAIDPRPAKVSDPRVVSMFTRFAELIGQQLDSERKQEQTRAALLDEQATGELREQFMAILGHDLRNPLSAVSACSQLLERKAQARRSRTSPRASPPTRSACRGLIDDSSTSRAAASAATSAWLDDVDDLDRALAAVVTEIADAQPGRAVRDASMSVAPCSAIAAGMQQLASNLLANAAGARRARRPIDSLPGQRRPRC